MNFQKIHGQLLSGFASEIHKKFTPKFSQNSLAPLAKFTGARVVKFTGTPGEIHNPRSRGLFFTAVLGTWPARAYGCVCRPRVASKDNERTMSRESCTRLLCACVAFPKWLVCRVEKYQQKIRIRKMIQSNFYRKIMVA